MDNIVYQIFPYALTFTAPILIVAIAGLINTKSGIINIGLDGIMVVGTLGAAVTVSLMYDKLGNNALILGLLISGVVGSLFSSLLAIATIKFKADHIISGIAINMLSATTTIFFAREIVGSGVIRLQNVFSRQTLPVLSDIPVIGPLIFTKFYYTTLLVAIIVVVVWYMFKYTKIGKSITACGENPHAAASAGINVEKVRYLSVLASGFLAGLGGGIVVLTYQGEFSGSVAGLGFLALTTLIFGKYKTANIVLASLFFGFSKTFGSFATINETIKQLNLPVEFYNALPFILTMIVIAIARSGNSGPKAAGEIYETGKR